MAELADDWPSLAPIRTSCSPRSDSSTSFHSTASSSASHHLSLAHKSSFVSTERTFLSPSSSSSSSSHLKSLLSSSSNPAKSHGLLSKCLLNAASPHGFPRQSMSGSPAGRTLPQRTSSAAAFGSYASFPGAQGSVLSPTTAASPLPSVHGSGACKGHLINVHAFTMIPIAAVGRKKPPDYLSDEPTSPEVTCIGRVRRNKNSTCAWDALANDSEKLCKRKKKTSRKKNEHHLHASDMDLQLAASIPRPLCMDPSTGATAPKWRKIISLFKDIRELHTPHLHIRKFGPEDFMINLDRLRRRPQRLIATTSQHNESHIDDKGTEINAGSREGIKIEFQSYEEEAVACKCADYNIVVQAEESGIEDFALQSAASAPPLLPPNGCSLLLMKNKSGRNKVFHDDGDDGNDNGSSNGEDCDKKGNDNCPGVNTPSYPPTLKAGPSPSQKPSTPFNSAASPLQKWSRKQAFGLWKSRKNTSSLIKAFVDR
ncbi:hypothetical protein L7F22_028619 [Adiantum nelumboides]|nr:hypothetical protein [Adiantum nelumboides]